LGDIETDEGMHVAWSPDGALLASAGSKAVMLWDAATRQPRPVSMPHSGFVTALAWSRDGRRLASSPEGDNAVGLRGAATGELRATRTGHTAWVSAVAFSPDGKALVSASYDGTVRWWSGDTVDARGDRTTLLRTWKGHAAGVLSMAFSP